MRGTMAAAAFAASAADADADADAVEAGSRQLRSGVASHRIRPRLALHDSVPD